MNAYSKGCVIVFFSAGLSGGFAVAADEVGQIESCLNGQVSVCSLETAQKRFAELSNEYNGYTEKRIPVGKYRNDGNERQYSLLKHYYSFQFLYELVGNADGEYFKETVFNEEIRRKYAQTLGEHRTQFSDADFADSNRFWVRYKEVLLSIREAIDAKTSAFEKKHEIPDYVIEQAKADAKYGMLLEMVYGPYIALKTGVHP